MLRQLQSMGMAILDSPNAESRRPVLDAKLESNVPGLFVVGDLAGAPVIKLAMEHGDRVARHISALPDAKATAADACDVLVIGAGASGLTAAMCLQEMGLCVRVLEKSKLANTIEDFPEGKWIYAEPDSLPATGRLWLEASTKEDLLARWQQIVAEQKVDVRVGETVTALERRADKHFTVSTDTGRHVARRVVLATGQRGNPRWLGVPGEDNCRVYHRLYSPKKYAGERILVVGGGNSAVEAAITLAEQNQVTLSYRGDSFRRIFKGNQQRLEEAIGRGRIEVIFQSEVVSFEKDRYRLRRNDAKAQRVEERHYDHAFVLVGAALPTAFLKQLGLRLENEWTGNFLVAFLFTLLTLAGLWIHGGKTGVAGLAGLELVGALAALGGLGGLLYSGWKGCRFSWLGVAFLVSYTVYGAKLGTGHEFWPYRGWGYEALSFGGRPWAFWYTTLYTAVMTVFGIQAMKRWGFDRKDKFQIWRYTSLLGFQWIFFFL
ncbi:MAG: NAD(P)-binding domain-containing protein, partial [Bryobacterales bacterium]|nr:NAD(P)-binding domain-containing protein [Bryobacterales bacterium]